MSWRLTQAFDTRCESEMDDWRHYYLCLSLLVTVINFWFCIIITWVLKFYVWCIRIKHVIIYFGLCVEYWLNIKEKSDSGEFKDHSRCALYLLLWICLLFKPPFRLLTVGILFMLIKCVIAAVNIYVIRFLLGLGTCWRETVLLRAILSLLVIRPEIDGSVHLNRNAQWQPAKSKSRFLGSSSSSEPDYWR